jgi:hypothetical protein
VWSFKGWGAEAGLREEMIVGEYIYIYIGLRVKTK